MSSRSRHSVGIFLLAIQAKKSCCSPCCMLMKSVSQCASTCSHVARRLQSNCTASAQASSVLSGARGAVDEDVVALPKQHCSAFCQPETCRYESCVVVA